MAIDGYCVKLDLDEVKEIVTLLRRCSNNLNQYTKKAYETGGIYEEDSVYVKTRLDEAWGIGQELLVRLAGIV